MTLRTIFTLSAAVLVSNILPTAYSAAGDLMFGCWTRPTCGKVCQLVCEPKKLTVVGYGYECKDICIPCPSEPGCKRCACCCGQYKDADGACSCCPTCQPQAPIFRVCWRDWCACGCAQPRTVKVLTKFQVEKKIDWFHWKVVDAGCCEGANCCDGVGVNAETHSDASAVAIRLNVYKSAPPEANLGDTFEISDDERSQVARWIGTTSQNNTAPAANERQSAALTEQPDSALQQASARESADSAPAWRTFSRWFGLGE